MRIGTNDAELGAHRPGLTRTRALRDRVFERSYDPQPAKRRVAHLFVEGRL